MRLILSASFFLLVTASVLCIAEEGVFLTKSEFEAFLQRYDNERYQNELSAPARSVESQYTEKKGLAWKKGDFSITPYGYVNVSLSYDSQKANSGDYCAFVYSPDKEDASDCQVDAKSSRFGFLIDGPGIPGWRGSKTQGCYEFDFQGPLTVRSRPGFMMRKAFVAISDQRTKILIGQDWEIISPLFPKTLNYTCGAATGNNGYRRAMLKLDRRFDLTHSTDLLLQAGLTDHVLRDASGVNWCTVSNGSWPVLQGRIAYAFAKNRATSDCDPCQPTRQQSLDPVTIGVSAHLGEQRFDFKDANPGRKHMKTWSFNVDLDAPLTKKLRLIGEYFLGENLSGVEGGVMQGVDLYLRQPIRSQGGWIGAQYSWTSKLQGNACFLIDDPFNDDLLGGSDPNGLSRTYNHCFFVNLLYNWNKALMTGFEVALWRTHWQQYNSVDGTMTALRPGKATRLEFVTRYTF